MEQEWLDHLTGTLKSSNILAYIWDSDADSYSWTGKLDGFLEPGISDFPRTGAAFNKMVNPQDVARRLSALHEALENETAAPHIRPSFSLRYKVRLPNGMNMEIEETASVRADGADGKRLVCGFLKSLQIHPSVEDGAQGAVRGPGISADLGFVTTGRRSLQHKIEQFYAAHHPDRKGVGYVLSIGIDRTALFNDVMGPHYADEIIEKTGERLARIFADSGAVMRINGDVYGVFVMQGPHNEMAAVARFVLNNFYSIPLQTGMGPVCVGISIGGVTLERSRDPKAAISMAEMAMHAAKDKGRNCFVSYDEASGNAEKNREMLKSADKFMNAIRAGRFYLAFQPIMSSKSSQVSFHESLIRLLDDDGRIVPAGAFMPAIEELGLARIVDQHALRMAVHELEMFSELSLSVNVSNLSLNNQDWLRSLVKSLRDRPSVARRLIVEITESTIIDNIENAKRIVNTLQDLGCRVALDDFGAGYTAFSQLKDLKVDIVKIDKSFIRNIESEHNRLFVKTLQNLAKGVNVETVGEGAETLAEAKLLADDGVDYIQGYVYGFPKVERLWLPKNHSHRKIPMGLSGDSAFQAHPQESGRPDSEGTEESRAMNNLRLA